MAAPAGALHRPRVPQATPLYRLVQAHYADVRDSWEERYEELPIPHHAFNPLAGAYRDDPDVESPHDLRGVAQARAPRSTGTSLAAPAVGELALSPLRR